MADPAAFIAAAKVDKILTDGTVRIQADVHPSYRDQVKNALGLETDVPVAIAVLDPDEARRIAQDQTIEAGESDRKYGQLANKLKKSAFFRDQAVWRAVGSDAEYLAWLRTQPCRAAPDKMYGLGPCEGDVVAAHYRSVAAGAGTGIKPEYSAIPLCNAHHQLQHDKGYSALGDETWWRANVIKCVSDWCWETLKQTLGYDSWACVPPEALRAWAEHSGVERKLPPEYRV